MALSRLWMSFIHLLCGRNRVLEQQDSPGSNSTPLSQKMTVTMQQLEQRRAGLALCEHCSSFLSNLIHYRGSPPSTTPRWFAGAKGLFVYRHHENLDALLESANSGCSLCTVLSKAATHHQSVRDATQRQIALLSETQPARDQPFLLGFKVGWLDDGNFEYVTVGDEPRDFQLYTTRPWYPLVQEPEVTNLSMPDDALFARALELDPSSECSFDVARAWLQHCEANHVGCSRGSGELPQLPTRVIDVGPMDNSREPYLFVTNQSSRGAYVALSHCWGGKLSFETRRETLDARCRGIPIADLPPTFQDAIVATRKLGMHYLWIDALCIIQGDMEDWAREAGRMGAVYEHARVTISALNATSSNTGLFRNRAPPRMPPIGPLQDVNCDTQAVFVRELPQAFGTILTEAAPLNKRGWVLQERVLAPRILHFSGEQLFWECCTRFYAEDGTSEPVHPVLKGLHEYLSMFFGTTLDADPHLCWYGLIEEYTLRALTYGSDKLPAVTGMATTTFRRLTGGRYCAGLWAEDMCRGLLWHANTFHSQTAHCVQSDLKRPDGDRAPSWSWASVDGKVTWDFLVKREMERIPTPNDCEVAIAQSDPSEGGSIKWATGGVEVRLACVGHLQLVTYVPEPFTGDGKWSGTIAEIDVDTLVHMDDGRDMQRSCTVVFMSTWHWTDNNCRFFREKNPKGPAFFSYHLLLERVASDDNEPEEMQVYRRVGFAKTFHGRKTMVPTDYSWITSAKQKFSLV